MAERGQNEAEAARKLTIPPAALAAQARASDASASVWVSANAGSGKTHVLTERVIRLLLRGTKPARILCLTYTKAAAAVMQTRIFIRLARWTSLEDAALRAELTQLEGAAPNEAALNQARRLFALALETPGGLKIQTIHAFCESLLHQFPLEANIPGHFELMNDSSQAELMAEAKKELLTEIYHSSASPAAAAFAEILAKAGEFGFDKLLAEIIARRQELETYAAQLAADNGETLAAALGLAETAKQAQASGLPIEAALAAELKAEALFDSAALAKIAAQGGARAADFAAKLQSAAAEPDADRLADTFAAAYLTKTGEAKKPEPLFTKKLLAVWPQLEELFYAKAAAVTRLSDALKSAALLKANQAAYALAADLLGRYAKLKQRQGLMDFGDLISRALALLKRKGAGQWVQYRLDQGIDHILVDEAQDTGPEQWEIIRLLSQDFFSGFGAREDLRRTIFAVGDEKQSIYSFQGASPQDFAANGRYQAGRAAHAGQLFRRETLAFSFRSAQDVLAAVDTVFAEPQNYQGLSADPAPTVHDAIRLSDQGYVEIWQVFRGEAAEEPQDWTQYQDKSAAPAVKLAESISQTIAHWLRAKEVLPGKNRPIQAGDIMILVRKRDEFVHALARSLKNAGIAVAGADRLRLNGHIAVRDLMALGDFVLQPRDDLALAAVLKSPLFNLSEEQLLALCAERQGTLWQALNSAAEEEETGAEASAVKAAAQALQSWRSFADIHPVYEFYSKILAQDGGRRRFLARLGAEAGDILDAFLEYCLEAQKTGLPGLQIFLRDLSENCPEIKREQDQSRNEVRIMTVHAAKGQEAPIVFLADSGSAVWHASHAPCLLPMPISAALQKQYNLPEHIRLWLPKAEYKTQAAAAVLDGLQAAAAEEYRRLLYVGMTRAEDRLIICGICGAREQEDTWLPVARAALAPLAEPVKAAAAEVEAVRFWQKKPAAAIPLPSAAAEMSAAAEGLPAFLTRPAPEIAALPRPLAPSGASVLIETEPETNPKRMTQSPILPQPGEAAAKSGFAAAGAALLGAMEKGTLIHSLLQYLPAVAAEKRRDLAAAFLKARLGAADAAQEQAQAILAAVFAVLEDKRFAPLYGAAGRSEIALMGLVNVAGRPRAISAQIDRIAFFADKILFADYKTGRPPQEEGDIPAVYKMQMALYAALLAKLYPHKKIEALLIYTQNTRIFTYRGADLLPLLA